jgi:tetratricopeptide (TPR) repeat protein
MKKIYNKYSTLLFILAAVIAGTFSACKNYLDVNPQGQITQEQIATDATQAKNLVTGIYNVFYIGGFDPDIDSFQFVVMTDIASDDADKGSTPDDYSDAKQIDDLQATPSNGVVNNVWTGHYQGIARANQALDKLAAAQFDDATKNALIGEAKFLRAYFYFNLVRLYGGVPLIDKLPIASEANDDIYQTRATADQIYQFIISDLNFAVANLPEKEATDVGRANKTAAQALEAKVYLYMKNYQKAYELSNAVITSGKYSLVNDYALIWRQKAVNGDGGNNNSESIFEIQAGINKSCTAGINLYTVSQGPRAGGKFGWSDLGFGFNNPSQALVNEYETNDVRKAATIITIQPNGTTLFDGFRIPSRDSVQNDRYSYKAYHSRSAEDNCGGNTDRLPKQVRILRYADILLINAEAAIQIGNTGAASTSLGLVRTRAKLGPVAPTLLNVWHERRVEMAEEHDRFFDIVRQNAVQPGRAAAAFAAHGKTWTPKAALFPIPQAQIDLSNGRLKQNPGY